MTAKISSPAAGTSIDLSVGTQLVLSIPAVIPNFTDDTTAAAGGVPVFGVYRTGSILKVRVT